MAVDAETTLNDLIGRVGRVRRWLLAISALRIAALGLASVSLYIGLYAWIDHHVHFGRLGRVSAFVLFASMLAAGLYYVVRVLRREMTYVYAANYVENRRSFDQQLVAAVEYYEGKGDYPYSQALARQLVLQVDRAAEGYRFDSTVAKWQGYLLSGFILLCLVVHRRQSFPLCRSFHRPLQVGTRFVLELRADFNCVDPSLGHVLLGPKQFDRLLLGRAGVQERPV